MTIENISTEAKRKLYFNEKSANTGIIFFTNFYQILRTWYIVHISTYTAVWVALLRRVVRVYCCFRLWERDKMILLFQESLGNIIIQFRGRTSQISYAIHFSKNVIQIIPTDGIKKKMKYIKKRIRCTPLFIVQKALSLAAIIAAAVCCSSK